MRHRFAERKSGGIRLADVTYFPGWHGRSLEKGKQGRGEECLSRDVRQTGPWGLWHSLPSRAEAAQRAEGLDGVDIGGPTGALMGGVEEKEREAARRRPPVTASPVRLRHNPKAESIGAAGTGKHPDAEVDGPREGSGEHHALAPVAGDCVTEIAGSRAECFEGQRVRR